MVVWFVRWSEEAACKRDTLRLAKQAFIPLGTEGGQAVPVVAKVTTWSRPGHDWARSARQLFKDPLELVL